MPVLSLTTSDLAGLFLRLLPRGGIWPKAQSAFQPQVIAALMPTYQRLVSRDNNLLVDAFPSTAVELLPEWEASLGLPDPCAGPDITIAQRQAHVVARLTQSIGPSVPSLTAFAAALGYSITITEFARSRFGRPFGGSFGGAAWSHTWRVTAPAVVQTPFAFGEGRFGEAFSTWGGTVLECELTRIKPAHTLLQMAYAGAPIEAPLDVFVPDQMVLA